MCDVVMAKEGFMQRMTDTCGGFSFGCLMFFGNLMSLFLHPLAIALFFTVLGAGLFGRHGMRTQWDTLSKAAHVAMTTIMVSFFLPTIELVCECIVVPLLYLATFYLATCVRAEIDDCH